MRLPPPLRRRRPRRDTLDADFVRRSFRRRRYGGESGLDTLDANFITATFVRRVWAKP